MAEIARILVERDQPITGSAIFLFNGAEGEWCQQLHCSARSPRLTSLLDRDRQRACKMQVISTLHSTRRDMSMYGRAYYRVSL
jgi:hypothetical protein